MMNNTNKIELIAEVAQGYEGNEKLAELLTTAAIKSGANSVKYQLVFADELATPDYVWYDLFKSLEMADEVWKDIADRIHDNRLSLYFDIFGKESLKVARAVGADGVKLSTTEFYNVGLIEEAFESFEKVIISVGGIPESDIDDLVEDLLRHHCHKTCLLYGFQAEPTPLNQNNLLKIKTLKEKYPSFGIGFMDHSDGINEDAFNLALVVLGLGVNIIEKHITLDHLIQLEDCVSGLSPDRFYQFSQSLRRYEQALGTPSLKLTPLELEYQKKAVKVVVSTQAIKAGTLLTHDNIALKRTGEDSVGSPIRSLKSVIGHTLSADIEKHSPLCDEIVCEN
jgi:N,N'-diacetyllegionaminate synthase